MLVFEDSPYVKHAIYLKEYYLLVVGYHLSQLIIHFMQTHKNDFIEMALHHMATIYLLFGSYLFNCWECGAIIAFLHDFSDFHGHMSKLLSQLRFEKCTVIQGLIMMSVWFWTRCFSFPLIIYQIW